MRWPWSRPRAPSPPAPGSHQDALDELDAKDSQIEDLIRSGEMQVTTLLGRVDRFSAEVAAVITGHEER